MIAILKTKGNQDSLQEIRIRCLVSGEGIPTVLREHFSTCVRHTLESTNGIYSNARHYAHAIVRFTYAL